jgi:hypothetical protein
MWHLRSCHFGLWSMLGRVTWIIHSGMTNWWWCNIVTLRVPYRWCIHSGIINWWWCNIVTLRVPYRWCRWWIHLTSRFIYLCKRQHASLIWKTNELLTKKTHILKGNWVGFIHNNYLELVFDWFEPWQVNFG